MSFSPKDPFQAVVGMGRGTSRPLYTEEEIEEILGRFEYFRSRIELLLAQAERVGGEDAGADSECLDSIPVLTEEALQALDQAALDFAAEIDDWDEDWDGPMIKPPDRYLVRAICQLGDERLGSSPETPHRAFASAVLSFATEATMAPQEMFLPLRKAWDDIYRALRQDQSTADRFLPEEDSFIASSWGSSRVEELAKILDMNIGALIRRARQIGARKPVRMWSVERASGLLAVSAGKLRKTAGIRETLVAAVAIDPAELRLISTENLYSYVTAHADELLARGADSDFIAELQETAGSAEKEACLWLSEEHMCQNPAASGFGLFCPHFVTEDGSEWAAGEDPKCSVRNLPLGDLEMSS